MSPVQSPGFAVTHTRRSFLLPTVAKKDTCRAFSRNWCGRTAFGRCNRLLGPPDFESADQKSYEPLIAKGFIILVLLVRLRILSLS